MGKTTWMVDQAGYLGREGARVGFCSVERPGSEITTKLLTNISGGDPRPAHLREDLAALPIWIDDSGAGLTPSQIRELVDDDPVDVLFIDYLQLLHADQRYGNRNAEIDQIMQDLQALHKDHEIQIILGCQLNRGIESRRFSDEHARPELQDLRDSGSIEQTADEVILMHREDYYREFKKNDGVTELILAKNRLGPTGTVRVTFIPEEETFIE
jgi:replicative DNA helicase